MKVLNIGSLNLDHVYQVAQYAAQAHYPHLEA